MVKKEHLVSLPGHVGDTDRRILVAAREDGRVELILASVRGDDDDPEEAPLSRETAIATAKALLLAADRAFQMESEQWETVASLMPGGVLVTRVCKSEGSSERYSFLLATKAAEKLARDLESAAHGDLTMGNIPSPKE